MITAKEKCFIATQEAQRCEARAKLMDKPYSDDFIHVAEVLREIALDYSVKQKGVGQE